jgi:acyl carrier protein
MTKTESTMIEAIREVKGIQNIKMSSNIFSIDSGLNPTDIVYVFTILEKRLGLVVNEEFIDFLESNNTLKDICGYIESNVDYEGGGGNDEKNE